MKLRNVSIFKPRRRRKAHHPYLIAVSVNGRRQVTTPLDGYDFVWASPPCQHYSESTPIDAREGHPDLIDEVRQRLMAEGPPCWVIENVDGARHVLRPTLMLCGTMFGLNVWRHRWFEFGGASLMLTPPCKHVGHPVVISGSAHGRGEAKVPQMRSALDVPWMLIRAEIRQAIPPAYSKYIGEQMMPHVLRRMSECPRRSAQRGEAE